MSLLPTRTDVRSKQDGPPRVVEVDSEDASEVLAALSSDTAREVLSTLHQEPATPSELADRVGTSLQNVRYHLGKLEDAGLITVLDTRYSSRGNEMSVYGPTDEPVLVFMGGEDRADVLRDTLKRMAGAFFLLAIASVLVQNLVELLSLTLGAEVAVDDAAGPTTIEAADAAETTDPATPIVDFLSSIVHAFVPPMEPGALFFTGGAVVLIAVFGLWWYRYRVV